MSIDKDSKNCALYIANGLIVEWFDLGFYPALFEVRGWLENRRISSELVTDDEINDIISKVAKYYPNAWKVKYPNGEILKPAYVH